MPFKKILLEGDVVGVDPATSPPPDVTTSGSVGTSLRYAREDHTHGIADGVVTESKLASNSVSTAKIQDGAVTTAKLNIDGNVDFHEYEALEFAFENLDTAPSTTKTGRIFYNTTDQHLYVYVGT
jgi:hypothetical protein